MNYGTCIINKRKLELFILVRLFIFRFENIGMLRIDLGICGVFCTINGYLEYRIRILFFSFLYVRTYF